MCMSTKLYIDRKIKELTCKTCNGYFIWNMITSPASEETHEWTTVDDKSARQDENSFRWGPVDIRNSERKREFDEEGNHTVYR